MSTTFIVILLAIAAVGLFVAGMSLSIIFKGKHIDSEIGENENMRKLGLKCAVAEAREEMGGKGGSGCLPIDGCSPSGCSACSTANTADSLQVKDGGK